jgi:hypothetical protein
MHDLLIERIFPNNIPRFQPIDKPFGIKRRNIRRATGGYNNGGLRFAHVKGLTVVIHY